MSEEIKQEAAPAVEPKEQPKAPEGSEFSDKELEELNLQMEKAQKALVSEEVQKQLESEKEKARAEALKEFEVNAKIKELEAAKAELERQRKEDQLAAARQLAELKAKVDSLTASRAVVSAENPFSKPPEKSEKGFDINTASPEIIDEIERNSMNAFFEQKRREI